MPLKRDATAGEYWRCEYLGLAKLLTQAVSAERVVSYACRKRCHSWRVLGVKIPMTGTTISGIPGEIATTASEF